MYERRIFLRMCGTKHIDDRNNTRKETNIINVYMYVYVHIL